ncbi:MAG: phosphoadenosine phosphosulfate reductase family protein [Erysipelotrichaceae bacterium]
MIEYVCKKCDGLICNTSKCPNCGNRTEIHTTKIFWCDSLNAPSFYEYYGSEKCRPISTDLRPVFAEERLLIEILLNKPMEFAGKSIWNTGSNTYIIDGKKMTIKFNELIKTPVDKVIKQLSEYSDKNMYYVNNCLEQNYIKHFIMCNKDRLNSIVSEAHDYIKEQTKGWNEDEMFVSFSGGKDSTVTSSLVMNALATETIPHIYCDTTLEYPTSKVYIDRFKKKHNRTPLLIAKNKDQDFINLCEVIGPPSRVLRWCCTIFKTGSITKKIESVFKNQTRILTFQGIRRNESKSRSKYDRESNDSKIMKQAVISPIIDWLDFDVWLYILSNNIDFNDAYRQGFSRVGCWCCPNNSPWSGFLSNVYMHEEYVKFYNILYDFAKKVGKQDWKEYVDEGKWKARQGGNGLEISNNAVVSFSPCALEENSYNFTLSREISDDLYVLFKPFGKLDFEIGNKRLNEVYVLDRKTNLPILKLTGRIGKNELKVSALNSSSSFSNRGNIEVLIKDQLTKYQMCIGCSACQSVCRFDALKVLNTQKGNVSNETISYTIDSDKCVGCLECVNHFDGGCYMKKVLRVKKGE